MASSLAAIAAYGDSDSDDDQTVQAPVTSAAALPGAARSLSSAPALSAAPGVVTQQGDGQLLIHPDAKNVKFNPKADQLYAPELGPQQPPRTQPNVAKNVFTGYVEHHHLSDFHFEDQRHSATSSRLGDSNDLTKATMKKPRKSEKRKRVDKGAVDDIDSFLGPWAPYQDEKHTAAPSEDQMKIMSSWDVPSRKRRAKKKEEAAAAAAAEEGEGEDEAAAAQKMGNERSKLHIPDVHDYMGRSFLNPPPGENLKAETPERCFLPKKLIHTWSGHSKGVNAIRFFPKTAHLLLSAGLDSKVKIWEVYGQRRCVRTYLGAEKAVRDIAFNNDGSRFLACGYDRYTRLWDTETGQCIARYTKNKIPYCVKFHPEEDKQHLFVVGQADRKILCYDTRTNEVVQEYDRHLGAVNTITFVEEGRRMVTTSDDKSLRVWEWDIPVDMKYIADPSMHSMPAVAVHPSAKWMITQSLDNTIQTFQAYDRFRQNRKKTFKGHNVAGYACQVNFAPNGAYVISGDAGGNLCIWDWKSTKLYSKFKAHDKVCIGAEWNPNEPSRVATCSWDGLIKYWD